jgi:hypothetical protein
MLMPASDRSTAAKSRDEHQMHALLGFALRGLERSSEPS